ncbi:ead/Ea22-like family protein [Escherichia coli]
MSKIDYQVLRAKAEKATCGEWSLEYGESRFDGDDALIHREVAGYIPICKIEGAHPESGFDEDFQMEQQANAEFIAAANPATVLALLGELEAAKKRIAELEAEPVSQTCKLNDPSGNSPVTPDGLSTVCAEAYQVVGVMADALGVFGDAAVQKVLDNLSQQKLVHRDVLPFSLPVTPDGWISCSERMPKETGDIIVVSDGIVMSGISYSRRDGFYIAALEYDDDEPIGGVTHWMPLPEPPRLKEL